ncbi:MAG: hypothetical protein ACQEXJ_06520 [Myxococcota bacterium]
MRKRLKLSFGLIAFNALLFMVVGVAVAGPPFHVALAGLGVVQVAFLLLLTRGSNTAHRMLVALSFLTAVAGALMVVAELASAAFALAVLYAAIAAFDGYLLRVLMSCTEDVDWIARQRLQGAAEHLGSEATAS